MGQISYFYQQGDLLLICSIKPKEAKRIKHTGVLAEGSATGHTHKIASENLKDCKFYKDGDVIYLKSKSEIVIIHEEHDQTTLPAGCYKMDHVQEFDYLENEARNVRD